MSEQRLEPAHRIACQNVRKLLEAERVRSGMTHAKLASLIGKSPKLVTAICNQRCRVTWETGTALAAALNVPLGKIIPVDLMDDGGETSAAAKKRKQTILKNISKLSPANQKQTIRVIQNLIDSQEES